MDNSTLESFEFVDDEMAAVLRTKSPVERLAIAHGMWEHARSMITAILKAEGGSSEVEIRREVARRLSHGAV